MFVDHLRQLLEQVLDPLRVRLFRDRLAQLPCVRNESGLHVFSPSGAPGFRRSNAWNTIAEATVALWIRFFANEKSVEKVAYSHVNLQPEART